MNRGIPLEVARRAALQTLIGAARIFESREVLPAEIVATLVGYEGTTAAAIRRMRELGFTAAVQGGLEAAYQKARAFWTN